MKERAMQSKWENADKYTGWNVVHVSRTAPVFGEGYTIPLGVDNTRPDETLNETSDRISERFDIPQSELILRISEL